MRSSWHCLCFFPFPEREMLGCPNWWLGDVLSWSGEQLRVERILQNNVWVSLIVSHSTPPPLHLLQTSQWALPGQCLGKRHPKLLPSFDYNKMFCSYESLCILQRTAWPLHMWLLSGRLDWVWSSPNWKRLRAFLNSQWLLRWAHFCDEESLLSRQRMHLFSQRLWSSRPRSIHTFTPTTDKRAESEMGCSQVAP